MRPGSVLRMGGVGIIERPLYAAITGVAHIVTIARAAHREFSGEQLAAHRLPSVPAERILATVVGMDDDEMQEPARKIRVGQAQPGRSRGRNFGPIVDLEHTTIIAPVAMAWLRILERARVAA